MVAVGEGLAGAAALGFGFGFTVSDGDGDGDGDGEGDSSASAGLLAWNGVEAASCARTRTAEMTNKIPIANKRMITVF